jgi:hypothetical protein
MHLATTAYVITHPYTCSTSRGAPEGGLAECVVLLAMAFMKQRAGHMGVCEKDQKCIQNVRCKA